MRQTFLPACSRKKICNLPKVTFLLPPVQDNTVFLFHTSNRLMFIFTIMWRLPVQNHPSTLLSFKFFCIAVSFLTVQRACVYKQIYEPFFADFGPLNLACTYRFCRKLHQLLEVTSFHYYGLHSRSFIDIDWLQKLPIFGLMKLLNARPH